MKKDLYKEMYDLEKEYWWHTGRKKLVMDIMKKYFQSNNNTILDFGCGTGMMLNVLETYGDVVGVDTSSEAIKFCKIRGIQSIRKIKTVRDLYSYDKKFDKKFDLITALDVIEHIDNENLILKTFYKILKNDGKVLITVPAYKFLWSYWDIDAGHQRRYTRLSLKTLLEKNGFKIIELSYFYSFVLPFVMILRIIKTNIPSAKKSSDFVRFPKIINSLLITISDIERKVLSLFGIPFGLSILCLAQKKAIN